MSKEIIILILAWVLTIGMLAIYVPRSKFREAQVIFFFMQLLTWILGLITVELRLLEYPVRLFSYANKTSFSFEYFIYPAICVIFNLYYPEKKGRLGRFMHFFYYCSVITLIEVTCERYTELIKYVHWAWYDTWISFLITFYLSRKYYVWFFRLKPSRKTDPGLGP